MDWKILRTMIVFSDEKRCNVRMEDVAIKIGLHPRNRLLQRRWSYLIHSRSLLTESNVYGTALTLEGIRMATHPDYRKITVVTTSDNVERIVEMMSELFYPGISIFV